MASSSGFAQQYKAGQGHPQQWVYYIRIDGLGPGRWNVFTSVKRVARILRDNQGFIGPDGVKSAIKWLKKPVETHYSYDLIVGEVTITKGSMKQFELEALLKSEDDSEDDDDEGSDAG